MQLGAPLQRGVEAFQAGNPVLIHDADDREGETDLLYPATAVTPDIVARLRNDGGGLIFVAIPDAIATTFNLPFLHDAIDHPATNHDDLGYDVHPSFSITVNHRDTYTGITDTDRALTIAALGDAVGAPDSIAFADEFRIPGHVHVLRAAPNLLADRRGHTELGLALAEAANCTPAVAGCEMLDDQTGQALATHDARAYADRIDAPFIEGSDLINALT